MTQPPPLTGIRVLEFAGLAPAPFAGLLLADYGATRPAALALLKALIPHVDVLLDPFRPGVLERLGLSPETVLLKLNPRLIVARMTGFRREGKYAGMAGHDINYIGVSGVLDLLGRRGQKPHAPGNLLGDFAGGGGVCFMGILLALVERGRAGRGQVVEANMVDGSSYMGSFPRLAVMRGAGGSWGKGRGGNVLDGGAPYYDTYETGDGGFMAVGALEPQFFAEFVSGLGVDTGLFGGDRLDKGTWETQRRIYTVRFKEKTRRQWEDVFDGTDACCTPVLSLAELEGGGFDQRPVVGLQGSPGFAVQEGEAEGRPVAEGQGIGVEGSGWRSAGLRPGEGGEEVLAQWMGWRRGGQYEVREGGLELVDSGVGGRAKSKL
ncbi:hypothetical protein LTR08_007373 [Meristemomyces frigidus]|nr:hypothetical protein LTR08_007373 [Meristemomyces frigidus]